MHLLLYPLNIAVHLLSVVESSRTQAHLPLSRGLPTIPSIHDAPSSALYVGFTQPSYEKPLGFSLDGDISRSVSAALTDLPETNSQPFHLWNVNHASGDAIFDCPEGFSFSNELKTCLFVEYAPPLHTCPYGSFKDRFNRGCLQVDSVSPDRTCPSGFQYFMRGCIRRTQVPPIITCANGYQNVQGVCFSASSIQPHLSCPQGFALQHSAPNPLGHSNISNDPIDDSNNPTPTWNNTPSCIKELIRPPQYQCPAAYVLVPGNSATPKSTSINDPMKSYTLAAHPRKSDSAFLITSERPQCLLYQEALPQASCPQGFELMSRITLAQTIQQEATSIRITELSEITDDDLICLKPTEYYGSLQCPPHSRIVYPPHPLTSDLFQGIRCLLNVSPDEMEGEVTTSTMPPPINTEPFKAFMTAIGTNLTNGYDFVTTIYTPSETVDTPATRRNARNRNNRGLRRLLMDHDNDNEMSKNEKRMWENVARKLWSNPSQGFNQNNWSTKNTQSSPRIQFSRKSCMSQPVSTFTWAEGKIPICRELQIVSPQLICQANSVVKCKEHLTEDSEDRRLRSTTSFGTPQTERSQSGSNEGFVFPLNFTTSDSVHRISKVNTSQTGCLPHEPCAETSTRPPSSRRNTRKLYESAPDVESCISQGLIPICGLGEKVQPSTPFCEEVGAQLVRRSVSSISSSGVEIEGLNILNDSHRARLNIEVCVLSDTIPVGMKCPFNVGDLQEDGSCNVLISQPTESICPEGFTRGTQEYSGRIHNGKHQSGRNQDLPFTSASPEMCELLEYADYQITCPLGYRRDKPKNSGNACIAEKAVAPSLICPPGYVETEGSQIAIDNPRSCQKTVEVAPTVLSLPESKTPDRVGDHLEGAVATACVLTKEKNLSCGVERKYQAATHMDEQMKFGQNFKSKMDSKGQGGSNKRNRN